MAKSLRSKWRRKCRAVKRVRYGEKELERLKKTLGIDDAKDGVNMEGITEIATVVDEKNIRKKREEKRQQQDGEGDEMETDKGKRVFNEKTLRDQHGTFPVWMHQRKIHKITRKGKKAKKGGGKGKTKMEKK